MKQAFWEKTYYSEYSKLVKDNPKYYAQIMLLAKEELKCCIERLTDRLWCEVNRDTTPLVIGKANAISNLMNSNKRYFAKEAR